MSFSISKQWIIDLLIILAIIMNTLGSYFYIINSSISVGFALTPIIIIYILFAKNKFVLTKEFVFLFFFIFIFLVCSFIGVIVNMSDNNLRVLKFVILLSIQILLFLSLLSTKRKELIDKSILIIVIILSVILILQFAYLITGIGLPPSPTKKKFLLIPTSVYSNPNDLSVISLFLLTYVIYNYSYYYKILLMLLIFFLIIISASRSSIVLAVLLLFLNTRIKNLFSIKKIILFLVSLTVVFIINFNEVENFFGYTFNRITSINDTFSASSISHYGNNSISLRINSLYYFFKHLFDIGLGGYNFKEYNSFFLGSTFYGGLIAENPHNFFVELSLLYGVLGLIAVVSLLLFIFFSLFKRKHGIIIIFILLIGFCVPSSIINFLPIWVIALCILIFNNSHEKKYKNSSSDLCSREV